MNNNEDEEVITAILLDDDLEDLDDEATKEPTVPPASKDIVSPDTVIKDSPIKEKESASVVINSFLQRRREQFKAKQRTRRQYVFLLMLVLLSVATVIVLTLESPLYDIDKVELTNKSSAQLTESELKQINKIIENLKGKQTYRLDLSSSQTKLDDFPFLSDAIVSKKWPSTIKITVNRRIPVGVVETDQGFVLVDTYGVVFEKTSAPDKSLPLFEGLKEVTYTQEISNRTYVDITKIVPQDMKGQISRIEYKDKAYQVVLSDGILIKVGDKTQLKEKLEIAWSIILTKGRKGIGYIDVSVPSIPVSGSPQLKVEV